MTMPMTIPDAGQPPQWGESSSHTSVDSEMRAAQAAPVEEQEALFSKCALYLYDNQVKPGVDLRIDPRNHKAWLVALTEWFGWDHAQRDAALNKLPPETFGGAQSTPGAGA